MKTLQAPDIQRLRAALKPQRLSDPETTLLISQLYDYLHCQLESGRFLYDIASEFGYADGSGLTRLMDKAGLYHHNGRVYRKQTAA